MTEKISTPTFGSAAELDEHLMSTVGEGSSTALEESEVRSVTPEQTPEEAARSEEGARNSALNEQLKADGFMPEELQLLEQTAGALYLAGNEQAATYIRSQITLANNRYEQEFLSRRERGSTPLSSQERDMQLSANEQHRKVLSQLLEGAQGTLQQSRHEQQVRELAEREDRANKAQKDAMDAYEPTTHLELGVTLDSRADMPLSSATEAPVESVSVPGATRAVIDKKPGFFERRKIRQSQSRRAEASRHLNDALDYMQQEINKVAAGTDEHKVLVEKRQDMQATLNGLFDNEASATASTVRSAKATAERLEFKNLQSREADLTKDQRKRLEDLGRRYQ